MDKIYLLTIIPENQPPLPYRAFDNIESAKAMGTSLIHEYTTPIQVAISNLEFDGRIANSELVQLAREVLSFDECPAKICSDAMAELKVTAARGLESFAKPPTSLAVKVLDPQTPGGDPPTLPGICPWCRKPIDPHFDIALGVNMWHMNCIGEFRNNSEVLFEQPETEGEEWKMDNHETMEGP